jgi:FkbM family methyltransferase
MLKILFNFPTRERPDRFRKSIDSIIFNIEQKGSFYVLVKLDKDDPCLQEYLSLRSLYTKHPIIWNVSKSKSKVDAINRDVALLDWDVMFSWADDIIAIQPGFDDTIRKEFEDPYTWPSFWDGYRKDDLITMCVISRQNYNKFGYVYHPDYTSVYCDNEMTEIARMLGRLKVIKEPQIVKHEHPALNTEIPFDGLYNLNDKSYDKDRQVFERRKSIGFLGKNREYGNAPLEYADVLYKYFDPDDALVIFEIGACEGEDTVKLQKTFPNAEIHAFEPIPYNYQISLGVVNKHTTLNQLALSDHIGEEYMYVSSGTPDDNSIVNYGNKSSSLLPPHKHKEIFGWCKFNEKTKVRVDTLKNYVVNNGISKIDFIHMDVQGAEMMVLNGCGDFIDNIGVIFLEVANMELYKGQPLSKDIARFFSGRFNLVYDDVTEIAGNQMWARIKPVLKFASIPKLCINLPQSVDRRYAIKQQFNRKGLDVEFFDAVEGRGIKPQEQMSSTEIACLRSHKGAIKIAKDRGYDSVFVCEDDIVFCDDFWKRIKYIESLNLDYDMFFLGGHFATPDSIYKDAIPTIHDNIWRVTRAAGAYAYIAKSSVYDRILDAEENLATDAFYCFILQRQINAYAFVPFLVSCAPCLSTITKQYTDYPQVKWFYAQNLDDMITFSKLGSYGRLGNQLFQVAATLALGRERGIAAKLPPRWIYRDYFGIPDEYYGGVSPDILVHVKEFHYDTSALRRADFDKNVDLFGYFQSEKYFLNIKDDILKWFTPEVKKLDKWSVGIHIRRGDYVGNPAHVNLRPEYYISAIDKYFSDKRYKFYICTDDVEYARLHFKGEQFVIEERTELQDFEILVSCRNHILANSSFSWWGAYLARSDKAIRPHESFSGVLSGLSDKDYWLDDWICHDDYRTDISDVTFIIPFKYDHPDRLANINMVIKMITNAFKTNIIIGEQGGRVLRVKYPKEWVDLNFVKDFHRTRMCNILTALAKTNIVVNIDTDIILPPYQIYEMVKRLRAGDEFVFPYDGTFVRVGNGIYDRDDSYVNMIKQSWDVGILRGLVFYGMQKDAKESMGGVFGYKKDIYFKYGGENENYVSYAPEDADRAHRFKMFAKYSRVPGSIYHINHFCGVDSSSCNPHFKTSLKEWDKVSKMDKDELLSYIKTWKWNYDNIKEISDLGEALIMPVAKERVDLRDVTFIIPVKYDHPDRKENLDTILAYIKKWFNAPVIVGEQGGNSFGYVAGKNVQYIKFDEVYFHRTKMINDMVREANTPIVFNWDADIVIDPQQVIEAIKKLKDAYFVYPYDGRFVRLPRECVSVFQQNDYDVTSLFGLGDHKWYERYDSVGGVIGFRVDKFWEGGGENENFISHGAEDVSRAYRFTTIYGEDKVVRVDGVLFHFDHYRSQDSKHNNEFYVLNNSALRITKSKNRDQLLEYIRRWPWSHKHNKKPLL